MGQADIFNPFVSPLPPATVCIPLSSFESVGADSKEQWRADPLNSGLVSLLGGVRRRQVLIPPPEGELLGVWWSGEEDRSPHPVQ